MSPTPQQSDRASDGRGDPEGEGPGAPGGTVTVRFWAGARAAAGTSELVLDVPAGPVTVDEVLALTLQRLHGRAGLERVLGVCSVLVGDAPAHAGNESVQTGQIVEFLPPFAGG